MGGARYELFAKDFAKAVGGRSGRRLARPVGRRSCRPVRGAIVATRMLVSTACLLLSLGAPPQRPGCT
jgi:hypothetical protein